MILDFFSQPVFQRLAVTLLHVLWQGAVIALLLGIVLRGLRRGAAQWRYVICGAAMALLVAAPVITFTLVPTPQPKATTTGNSEPTTEQQQDRIAEQPAFIPAENNEADIPARISKPEPATANDSSDYQAAIAAAAPYVVLIWMFGVLLFGLRLLGGFLGVRSLSRSRIAAPPRLLQITQQLSRAMRMASTPLIACSERIGEAMVVGFLRPVVLVPLSWLTQLPPDVLRSVVAHELAHVRRWDRWVNLLQRIVEVVLFYHPAVWWMSQRMRTEREFRCDELAANAVGNPVAYAEALECIGRMRVELQSLILATTFGGTKMALLKRVRNVLGASRPPQKRGGWSAGVLALCLPAALCGAAVWWQAAQAEEIAFVQEGEKRKEVERERREVEERRNVERRREGERREVERRREGERREGDRPREGRERGREGDRPREGRPPRGREGDRPGRPEGPPRFRDGDRPGPGGPGGELRELMTIIRQLRAEVAQLRREVNELKGRPGAPRGRDGDRPRPPFGRDGDRPRPPRGEGDRPRPPRGEGDRPREREGERPRREGDRERPRGEERPRRETDRRPEGERERPRVERPAEEKRDQ